jgi:hypothetical protein
MGSIWTHGLGLCTHFTASLGCISHTVTEHSTSTLLPEPERHEFTPKGSYQSVSLGVDQTPLLRPEAGLNSNLGSYQSDGRRSPHWFLHLTGSIVSEALTLTCLLASDGTTSPSGLGTHPSNKGDEKHRLCNPGSEPPEMLWESKNEMQDTEAVQQEATFYCASTDSVGSYHLIYSCKQVTEARSKV